MNKTVWKSKSEISYLLNDYQNIAILSCGTCANLSYTGGKTGIKALKGYLGETGKKISLSKVILACCPEEIMRQALKQSRKALSRSDALIVLSCAAGIKSANACRPGPPVISILDSVGSAAVSCSDPLLAQSLCTGCGHCVLTYTAGICPVSECPSKSRYGPCKLFPQKGLPCPIHGEKECIWHAIESRNGSIRLLNGLKEYHNRNSRKDLLEIAPEHKKSPLWKKFFAWHAARIEKLEWIIRHFR